MNLEEYNKIIKEQNKIIKAAQNKMDEAKMELLASDGVPKIGDIGIMDDEEVRIAHVDTARSFSKTMGNEYHIIIDYINRKKKNGEFSNKNELAISRSGVFVNGVVYRFC